MTSAITRRKLLKGLGLGAAAILVRHPAWAAPALPVPPILMLHSRHRWLLPDLLDALLAEGYRGVTFGDLAYALAGEATLPSQPVIITIDDLELVRGNPSYDTFTAMKDALVERHFKGVFSIITSLHLEQMPEWWQEIATWGKQGIEFATHTAYHSNLDNPAFTADDFRSEIVESAQTIRAQTRLPVYALVTPYGSGYDRATQTIKPEIVAACRQARLQFVVGIVDGHGALPLPPPSGAVMYLGRVPPGPDNSLEGALFEVRHW